MKLIVVEDGGEPEGLPWEMYTVVEDTAHYGASPRGGVPTHRVLPPVTAEDVETAAPFSSGPATPTFAAIRRASPTGKATADPSAPPLRDDRR